MADPEREKTAREDFKVPDTATVQKDPLPGWIAEF